MRNDLALNVDLDAVYAKLMSFKADGGGDGPESVNQALHEAVHKMTWSKDRDVLKIIFLVGDYPPHMDYEQDVKYPITCKQAMEKDLIINTIQCGNHAPTTPIWQEIARLSEGTYASIGQSGDMVAVATPMDDKIAELNRRLADTVVPYGDVTVQTTTAGKISAIKAAPAEAAADRASYAESTGLLGGEAGRRSVVTGADDVVSQLAREEITEEDLDKLEAEKLPDDLKKLSTEKRKQVIQERLEQRKKLQKQLDELIVQRRDYLKKRIKEREAEQRDSFDAQIAETIQKQAARKGIEYDEKEKPARD